MASKYLQKYPVPSAFQQILADFTRQVLRDQPGNIIQYGAKYFEMLQKGKKFEFDSKYNVKKDDKKYELAYNPKNAQEITKKASNIANKIEADVPISSEKTVNQQQVEAYVSEQSGIAAQQKMNEIIDSVVEEYYTKFDSDKSGFIENNEIKNLCQSISRDFQVEQPTQAMISQFKAALDTNDDGKISKEQFKAFVTEICKQVGLI